MTTQISWLIEDNLAEISVERILRGYAVLQLGEKLENLIHDIHHENKLHFIIDASQMQPSYDNIETLYNIITPLIIHHQVRWIVIHTEDKEIKRIFKEIMAKIFQNPCVLLNNRDEAIDFLYRKDPFIFFDTQGLVAS